MFETTRDGQRVRVDYYGGVQRRTIALDKSAQCEYCWITEGTVQAVDYDTLVDDLRSA